MPRVGSGDDLGDLVADADDGAAGRLVPVALNDEVGKGRSVSECGLVDGWSLGHESDDDPIAPDIL
jgi:hypothetical protein